MKTPYEILEVGTDATDVAIKQAYLQKVKANPPDRDQQQFQLIHNAYETIKDGKSRMRYELFTIPSADFDEVLDQALHTAKILHINPEQFDKLLYAGVDEKTVLNAMTYSEKSSEKS